MVKKIIHKLGSVRRYLYSIIYIHLILNIRYYYSNLDSNLSYYFWWGG
jgi:hypothetical protein